MSKLWAVVACWALATCAQATGVGAIDLSRYLFVALRDHHDVAVIDIDLEARVDAFDAGLAPDFVAVSLSLNKLVAADGRQVNVIDAVTRARTQINLGVTAEQIRLSPSGTRLAAISISRGLVEFVDLIGGRSLGQAKQPGANADALFQGDSRLLFDAERERSTALDVERFKLAASVQGERGLRWIYPAWFDTVAFADIASSPRLLVYDLDRVKLLDRIALRGAPGRGLVTGDGAWLLLPIPAIAAIEVIDARLRRSRGPIAVGGIPVALAMAGNFGLCH